MFTDFFSGVAKYTILFVAAIVFVIYLLVRPGKQVRQQQREMREKQEQAAAQKNNEEK